MNQILKRLLGRIRSFPSIVWIVVLFLALGLIYGAVNPLFESPDESSHYPVIKHLADGHGFLVQHVGDPAPYGIEPLQPPLYYMAMALLTFWIDTDDLPALRRFNPHNRVGVPLAHGNKNLIVHTAAERFPWRGTVLAVHLIRIASLGLGVGTILCTRALARRLWPNAAHVADAAAGFVAFNPMFVFISASVNNDNAIHLTAALGLWLIVLHLEGRRDLRHQSALGLLLGLAALSKLSGLTLWPVAALALTLTARQERSLANLVQRGALVFGIAIAVCGWWYARNALLYNDLLSINHMADVAGRRALPPDLYQLRWEFDGVRISFWGLFGGFNVPMASWLYPLFDAISIVAALGVLLYLRKAGPRSLLYLLMYGLFALLVIAGLVRWTRMTPASQGRLLFPAIAVFGTLLATGFAALSPSCWRRHILLVLASLLFLLAFIAPFRYILPAYARPPLLTPEQIPASATRTAINLGNGIRLVAYEILDTVVHPGDELRVRLYWQALKAMDEDYTIFIHVLGRDGEPIGQIDTYPGLGSFPTSVWQPGDLFADTYWIPIGPANGLPVAATIDVGAYSLRTGEELPTLDERGNPRTGVLGYVKLAPRQPTIPDIPRLLAANFNNQIELAGHDLPDRAQAGTSLTFTLYWRSRMPVATNYTVFVHLLDGSGHRRAQQDQPPQQGQYPTSLWEPGEVIPDPITLAIPPDLPPGDYALAIGLYDLATGARLPLLGQDGQTMADQVRLPIVIQSSLAP